jgi:hypothetical protein
VVGMVMTVVMMWSQKGQREKAAEKEKKSA